MFVEKKEWYEKSSSKSTVETSKKGHDRTWENLDVKKAQTKKSSKQMCN